MLFSVSEAVAQSLVVSIPDEKIQLEYPQPVRLEKVLADTIDKNPANSPLTYSIANQLFDQNRKQQALALKTSVLQRLSNIDSSLHNEAQTLSKQIQSWDVGYRLFIPLDYDQTRLMPEFNPMLKGQYELLMPKRDNNVLIEGLISSPKTMPLSTFKSIAELSSQVSRLPNADKSHLWVIYPDGKIIRTGYAYWNKEHIQLAPNSRVFFGFSSESESITSLEKDIITLLSMRKGL